MAKHYTERKGGVIMIDSRTTLHIKTKVETVCQVVQRNVDIQMADSSTMNSKYKASHKVILLNDQGC